jgi:hypothetical protein
MISVELDSETDFNGWRRYARGLALNDVPASNVVWNVGGAQAELAWRRVRSGAFGTATPLLGTEGIH